jgi:creatinine amidohydrolase
VTSQANESGGGVRFWQDLTSAEVAEAVRHDPVVVLPVAAIEQHGPHLPLSTDAEIGRGIMACAFSLLPDDVPAWVLPAQVVGASAEHMSFPGTLSIPGSVLGRVIRSIGTSLAAAGVRRLVLFNSHGGNRDVLDRAGLELRARSRLLVVKATYARFPRPEKLDLPESEWTHGLHGGAVETAMMLHLRPDLVKRADIRRHRSLGEELDGSLRRLGAEGVASFSWLAQDLSASGAMGDASLASEAMGRVLVHHYGGVLAEVIRDARDFPVARLG